MQNKKISFWERMTGGMGAEEEHEEPKKHHTAASKKSEGNWIEEENEEAELAVDMYETAADIIVQTFVAGVRPEDLELSISRDMITIKGKREESRNIDEDSYFSKELYWGRFSRTISLPQEVETEEVEATERHGLLTVKIKKVDKEKKNSVRVKSV